MVGVTQLGYAGLFAGATVGCLLAAYRARSFDDPELRRSLVTFLGLTGLWGATSVGQLLVNNGPLAEGLFAIGLIIGLGTVVVWLWFASVYAGYDYHRDRRLQTTVLGVYAVIVLIKLTNPIHGAYYSTASDTALFAPEFSALYWTVTGLAYIGAGIGLYMLFEAYARSKFDTTKLAVLTLIAGLPVVPTIIIAFRPNLLLPLYYEPIGVAIFGLGVVATVRETFISIRGPARQQVTESLTDAIIVVNTDQEIVDYNVAAQELFPELDGAVNQPLGSVTGSERIDETTSPLAGETTELIEIYQEGKQYYYQVRRPEITLGDRVVGEAIVLSDVTKLEMNRRRLEQQRNHMDNLTEAMAHELRNPLTIVLGQLQRFEGQDTEPPTDEELSVLREETTRMSTIIDDLISVIKSTKPITETTDCPLRDLLVNAWEQTGESEIQFDNEIEESTILIADCRRAQELFERLFEVHKRRDATVVTVTQSDRTLVVDSDGTSFETTAVDPLFEYGVEAGEQEGLALAHARTLANLHGWQITADLTASTPRLVMTELIIRNE